MSIKESIMKSLRLSAEGAEKKISEDVFLGSNFYHNYFAGYSERRELADPSGKEVIRREYTGAYYMLKEGKKAFNMRKIVYTALSALSLASFIIGISAHVSSSYSVFGAAPGLTSLILWIFTAASLIRYVTRPYMMKKWDYNAGPGNLELFASVTAVLMAATALVSLVFIFTGGSGNSGNEAVSLIFKAAAAGFLYALVSIEKKAEYIKSEEQETKTGWMKID